MKFLFEKNKNKTHHQFANEKCYEAKKKRKFEMKQNEMEWNGEFLFWAICFTQEEEEEEVVEQLSFVQCLHK